MFYDELKAVTAVYCATTLRACLRSFVLIQIYALAGAVCLAQVPSAEVEKLFQEALQMQQNGDIQGAIAAYKHLLQIRPGVAPALANLGAALAKTGRYEEAIVDYREALKGGETVATRLNLALAYYKLGDFRKAVSEFDRVRTEEPGNPQANDLAADCYLRMGDYARVIDIAGPLAAANQADLAVQYILGTALIRDHRNAEGQRVIDRILQHGENAGANLLQAEMAIADENYLKADSYVQKAIQEAPQLPDAYLLAGIAKEGLGDHAAAKEAFRQSLALDPNEFDAHLQLGALLTQDADLDEARVHIEAALRERPSSPAALYRMGLVEKQSGKLEQACDLFEQAEKGAPNWLPPHVQLATLYYRLRRPEDGMRERQAVSRLSESHTTP